MAEKYYLDSCIWRDYFENRSDKFRPLGEWAFALIKKIIREDRIIVYSDLVEEELKVAYSEEKIHKIFSVVPKEVMLRVIVSKKQLTEAIQISKTSGVPVKDALHAVLARDNCAVLVSRDKHFYEIEGISVKTPEELI